MILGNTMSTPELVAMDKVRDIVNNQVTTMADTRSAAKVIDSFELSFPREKEFIHFMRNELSDKTFIIYKAIHG